MTLEIVARFDIIKSSNKREVSNMSKYQIRFSFWGDTLFTYSFFIKASTMDDAVSIGAKRVMHVYGFKSLDEIYVRKAGN